MIDQILQNSQDNIDIEVLRDGTKIDPDSNAVTVTITDPNGAVIKNEEAGTRASIGRYYSTLSSSETVLLGTYLAVWTFAIDSSVFTHQQNFEVVAGAISTAYLLPDEYRSMTTLDVVDKSDTELRMYIKRASLMIDSYLGGTIRKKTYTEYVRAVVDQKRRGLHIQLTNVPVLSLDNMYIQYGGDTVGELIEISVEGVRIDTDAGFIEYGGNPAVISACTRDYTTTRIKPVVKVIYDAGYEAIPEEIEFACMRLTDQLVNLETKEFKALQSLSASGYNENYRDSKGQLDIGRIGGDEVIELLRGFKRMVPRNIMII